MANQLSISVRNARLDAIETAIGTSPLLKLYELTDPGTPPPDCGNAIAGTVLAELALPSDWLAAAASGSKAKTGVWTGVGIAAGDVDFYRIYDSGDTTCHMQGTVTVTGGGGDMTIDVIAIEIGNTITGITFTLTDGNA